MLGRGTRWQRGPAERSSLLQGEDKSHRASDKVRGDSRTSGQRGSLDHEPWETLSHPTRSHKGDGRLLFLSVHVAMTSPTAGHAAAQAEGDAVTDEAAV